MKVSERENAVVWMMRVVAVHGGDDSSGGDAAAVDAADASENSSPTPRL